MTAGADSFIISYMFFIPSINFSSSTVISTINFEVQP